MGQVLYRAIAIFAVITIIGNAIGYTFCAFAANAPQPLSEIKRRYCG
jgi:hypothetical protein